LLDDKVREQAAVHIYRIAQRNLQYCDDVSDNDTDNDEDEGVRLVN
jgi:hypothetical protein